MQVSVVPSSSSQSSLAMNQRQMTSSSGSNAATAVPTDAITGTAQSSNSVALNLSTQAQTATGNSQPNRPPEVFAEIWRDGIRIGSVYTDGTAVLSGSNARVAGTAGSIALPYLEAQRISAMLGGEVRYVDMGALQVAQTRSQLRSAYGA